MRFEVDDRVEFLGCDCIGAITPASGRGAQGVVLSREHHGSSSFIRIKWDDGGPDGGWWDEETVSSSGTKSTLSLENLSRPPQLVEDTRGYLEAVACDTP